MDPVTIVIGIVAVACFGSPIESFMDSYIYDPSVEYIEHFKQPKFQRLVRSAEKKMIVAENMAKDATLSDRQQRKALRLLKKADRKISSAFVILDKDIRKINAKRTEIRGRIDTLYQVRDRGNLDNYGNMPVVINTGISENQRIFHQISLNKNTLNEWYSYCDNLSRKSREIERSIRL